MLPRALFLRGGAYRAWLCADERRATGRDVADVGDALSVVPASPASDDRIFAAAARTCDQVTVERNGDTFIRQILCRLDDLAAVVGGVTEAGHNGVVYIDHFVHLPFG